MNENTRRSAHRSFRDAPALSIALALVCTAAVSLLTAVAAVAPSTARADDGLPTQLPSVASLTDAATAAATDVVGATGTPDVTTDADAVPALDAAPATDAAGKLALRAGCGHDSRRYRDAGSRPNP